MFKKYFKKDSKENCNDKNRNKNYVKYRFGNYKRFKWCKKVSNRKIKELNFLWFIRLMKC